MTEASQSFAMPATGSAVVVNVWSVFDGSQQEFVEAIEALFEHGRNLDGFVEGVFLQGADPTRFVTYVRMRTPQDRQRLLNDPEVEARLRAAEDLAEADLHSYDVLRAFAPPAQ